MMASGNHSNGYLRLIYVYPTNKADTILASKWYHKDEFPRLECQNENKCWFSLQEQRIITVKTQSNHLEWDLKIKTIAKAICLSKK